MLSLFLRCQPDEPRSSSRTRAPVAGCITTNRTSHGKHPIVVYSGLKGSLAQENQHSWPIYTKDILRDEYDTFHLTSSSTAAEPPYRKHLSVCTENCCTSSIVKRVVRELSLER